MLMTIWKNVTKHKLRLLNWFKFFSHSLIAINGLDGILYIYAWNIRPVIHSYGLHKSFSPQQYVGVA